MQIDVVCEGTSAFTKRHNASKHMQAGARQVLISVPKQNAGATVLCGVNHGVLSSGHRIV